MEPYIDRGDEGFTLIALLALIAISGILMASIAPTWSYVTTRDAEEELIFRGESYVKAVGRFQVKNGRLPMSLKELEEGHFIRKLYTDPITDGEFSLILQAPDGKKMEHEIPELARKALRGKGGGNSSYGILGVISTSSDKAIRPYKEKEYYNEWEFVPEKDDKGKGNPGDPGPSPDIDAMAEQGID
jgi:type II secretory pathway pseudopilin PulG